ncbi:MAG: hypothetical protein SWQ30_05160 [Thermodesulfobacteriota bacterium]|nr:hypothetical protein [Thermodesulfobacteriota bacterium]
MCSLPIMRLLTFLLAEKGLVIHFFIVLAILTANVLIFTGRNITVASINHGISIPRLSPSISKEGFSYGHLLHGVLWFLVTALVTLFVTKTVFNHTIGYDDVFAAYWHLYCLTLLALVSYGACIVRGSKHANVLSGIFIALFVFTILNSTVLRIELQRYGDLGWMPRLTSSGEIFARWFMGTAMLGISYDLFSLFGLIDVPVRLFLKIAGSLVMCVFSVILIRRSSARLEIVFPTFLPLWVMFSTGYDEYYAFVCGGLLFVLFILFHQDLASLSFISVGCLVAVLPLLYIAFAPISLFVLFFYGVSNRRQALPALVFGSLSFVLLLMLFGYTVPEFLVDLKRTVSFGTYTREPRFSLHMNPYFPSIFTTDYAFSREHLYEMLYMLFFGGGLFLFLVSIVGVAVVIMKRYCTLSTVLKNERIRLGTSLVVFYMAYHLLWVPRLGLSRDIDLFFLVYVIVGFLGGAVWDFVLARLGRHGALVSYVLVSAVFGHTLTLGVFLWSVGLPPI